MKKPYWKRAWFLLYVAVLLWLCAEIALAYPENIRLGYPSCASCHVSPTGGGALTSYGRSTSEELATWSEEGWGRVFGAIPTPEWFAVGGDTRHVTVKAPGYSRSFYMQDDVELAVSPVPGLWVAGSIGLYGEEQRRELRRHYVMVEPLEGLRLRLGRFMPAYGLMLPDHTVATRGTLGWQQGRETYNAEASYTHKRGELFVTTVVDSSEAWSADEQGYKVRATETGATVRAAAYVGDRAQVGASYWFGSDVEHDWLAVGAFGSWGVTRNLYLLGELDQRNSPAEKPLTVSYTQLGYELWRGVHLRSSHEYTGTDSRWGAGLQLFPIPHWEILFTSKYSSSLWSHTLLLHVNI